jgi:phytoene synthase
VTDAVVLCRESIARHSKSFALASRLLPPSCRDEAAVVYAFCRRADDAIDLVPASAQPGALARLKRELDSVHAREAQEDPVLAAFQAVVFARKIPSVYAEELLLGMQMDATGHHYETYEDLLEYCYRVAGTVGLMMSHVMGVSDPSALSHAAHLGMGMQLTNICRDVKEDWDRGRLYLPRELLRVAGLPSFSRGRGREFPVFAAPAVRTVTRELLGRAEDLYASGDRGIPLLPRRAAAAVRAARLVYSDIGRVIAKQGYDPLAPRAVVSAPRKLALVAAAWTRTWFDVPRRFEAAPLDAVVRFSDVVSA